jgi:hypothetical protein
MGQQSIFADNEDYYTRLRRNARAGLELRQHHIV